MQPTKGSEGEGELECGWHCLHMGAPAWPNLPGIMSLLAAGNSSRNAGQVQSGCGLAGESAFLLQSLVLWSNYGEGATIWV